MPRQIQTHLWTQALVRRAQNAGAMAMIAKKGDAMRGDVLVRVLTLDGQAWLYAPAFSMDNQTRFSRLAGPLLEAEAEAKISRRTEQDPDLWVIDIEDRDGRHFLTEALIKSD